MMEEPDHLDIRLSLDEVARIVWLLNVAARLPLKEVERSALAELCKTFEDAIDRSTGEVKCLNL
jgi:hypothetical protein